MVMNAELTFGSLERDATVGRGFGGRRSAYGRGSRKRARGTRAESAVPHAHDQTLYITPFTHSN